MSSPEIRPVDGARELDRFIALPNRLHAADATYVAPLKLERRQALSQKSNPLFKHVEAQFWMAWRDGRPVGRISAQADPRLGEVGQFGLIAAEDDGEIFHALFSTAEEWLKSRGKTQAQGPFNLNINEESGLLVDGFDTPPMLLMPHDLPYVAPRVEAEGYAKVMDLFAYLHDTQVPFPRAIERILERERPADVKVRHMDWSRYHEELATVVDIFNDAWSENWGFLPFGPDELDHMAKSMKLLLDERLLWFVEVKGRPAAFGLSLPNLNEMIRDLDGELLPFGWAKLLWRLKRRTYTSGRIPLMGVRREFHSGYLGKVLPLFIFEKFREEGRARNVRHVEMSWVLETNKPMRHIGEALGGGRAYKTYRIYEKALAR
ncbi:dATP pyrophosphohydrolase [Hansschlegelia zhihuaiae]|uniref:dATP pyrophosphohydrolase n=1 Tax=Hansschlegelia zhihuaiae TaxID=405005 RepID=A0A4Q0MP50_9HYPH|nr:dATP pyrophosphohydrolase [Hansschlegelia zhihuaiae]RXF75514.1 dATP pyrophosphohydrolase [Hansschlegelia zhihuaiae]